MIYIDQLRDVRTGGPLLGYHVRNKQGKIIATGAAGVFVQMRHKRYANDRDLVAAVRRLTGLEPRP